MRKLIEMKRKKALSPTAHSPLLFREKYKAATFSRDLLIRKGSKHRKLWELNNENFSRPDNCATIEEIYIVATAS